MQGRPTDLGRKGRGTAPEPAHRLTTETREAEAPTPTTVSYERIERALSRNDSPDVPVDRSVNPYTGCEHEIPPARTGAG